MHCIGRSRICVIPLAACASGIEFVAMYLMEPRTDSITILCSLQAIVIIFITWELPPGVGINSACCQGYHQPSGVSAKRHLSIYLLTSLRGNFRIPPTRIEIQSLYL